METSVGMAYSIVMHVSHALVPRFPKRSLVGRALIVAVFFGAGGCVFDLPDVRVEAENDASVSDGGRSDGGLAEASQFDSFPDSVRPDGAVQDSSEVDVCSPVCQGKCAGESDGCGGTCPTNSCATGQICATSGKCCTPKKCSDQGYQCGNMDDGCGHSLSCGACSGNEFCVSHHCEDVGVSFALLVAGEFDMGSPTSEDGRDTYHAAGLDETRHHVKLTHDFYISRTEITQSTFKKVMGYNPSKFTSCGGQCPVEMVTWDEAAAFANKLSEGQGLQACFQCTGSGSSVKCDLQAGLSDPYGCKGYRMPTEAEWEFAARGGTSTAVYSGDVTNLDCEPVDPNLNSIGWYRGNSSSTASQALQASCGTSTVKIATHPVGLKTYNVLGLADMMGNVWEWTLDCPNQYPTSTVSDPVYWGTCYHKDKVFRGCGFGNYGFSCRHAERASNPAKTDKGMDIGIRIVRSK